jgi:hypothetical protein
VPHRNVFSELIAISKLRSGTQLRPIIRKLSLLVFSLLPAEFLKFSPLALEFGLIALDLTLLLRLSILLSLELISDQRPGAQSKEAAHRRPRAGMPGCRANDAARGGSAQRANPGALFTGCQTASGAADSSHNRKRHKRD